MATTQNPGSLPSGPQLLLSTRLFSAGCQAFRVDLFLVAPRGIRPHAWGQPGRADGAVRRGVSTAPGIRAREYVLTCVCVCVRAHTHSHTRTLARFPCSEPPQDSLSVPPSAGPSCSSSPGPAHPTALRPVLRCGQAHGPPPPSHFSQIQIGVGAGRAALCRIMS